MIALADVQAARARQAGAIYTTPCARSEALSRMLGCELYLKLENLQMTGSFKERGALNRLLALTTGERAAGVIAASAGNHAQGVAFVARRLGIGATIVMPRGTPLIKVASTRGHGATVILHGEGYDDAAVEAARLAAERGLCLVPPFDDDRVIAGQGTLGLELLEQVPDLDAIVLPIGGGGLASGVGVAVKSQRPEIAIYGAEAACVPSMERALAAGHPVRVPASKSLAEGVAVREVSARTLAYVQRYVDRVALVDEPEIARAVLVLLELEKTVAEGAGAVAFAAAMGGQLPLGGKRVVVVVSGGNIDVNLLARIIDRGLVQSGRCMRVRVLLPDVPGALASLLATVAASQANVLEVHHDRLAARTGLSSAAVELLLETRGFDHVREVEAAIANAGLAIES
jgi:threonine dehydratase